MAKHTGARYSCDQCDHQATTTINLVFHKKVKHEAWIGAWDGSKMTASLELEFEVDKGTIKNIKHILKKHIKKCCKA